MIVGQEKPPLDELVHFGVKGMKWGVRKENRTSLANIGDRLNKKKAPLFRAIARNQGAAAAVGLGVTAAAGAATALTGGAASPLFIPAITIGSTINAGAQWSANFMTVRDLAAISASDLRRHKAKKK